MWRRGRAAAKAGTVLARLFPSKASALTLPNELFWRVLEYWNPRYEALTPNN